MSALGRIAKRGGRFSRNAVTPSRASAERPMYSERATRPASPIPQPDQSSTAIVHRRPRGSQDASCSVPQGQSPTPRLGRITDGRGRRRASRPKAGLAPESLSGGAGPGARGSCPPRPGLHRGDEPWPTATARAGACARAGRGPSPGGLKSRFNPGRVLARGKRPRLTGYKTVTKLLEPEGVAAFRLRGLDAPRLAFLDDIRD